jgi:hypothetical protein
MRRNFPDTLSRAGIKAAFGSKAGQVGMGRLRDGLFMPEVQGRAAGACIYLNLVLISASLKSAG